MVSDISQLPAQLFNDEKIFSKTFEIERISVVGSNKFGEEKTISHCIDSSARRREAAKHETHAPLGRVRVRRKVCTSSILSEWFICTI